MTSNSTSLAAKAAKPRAAAEGALLDAAERLLVDSGHAAVTTRRLAQEAGVNHGLVHYYFGSIENVLAQVLERFTSRLIERQRALYASDAPFLDKWRQAMTYLEADARYQKIWLELQALAWNRPDLQARVARVTEEWRAVLTDALAKARAELSIELPLPALVALVATFNQGMMLERLIGVGEGHGELLAWIEEVLGGDS
jgi:TetR/AcrR family transcriptional regulator